MCVICMTYCNVQQSLYCVLCKCVCVCVRKRMFTSAVLEIFYYVYTDDSGKYFPK